MMDTVHGDGEGGTDTQQRGLYAKYTIINNETGEEVQNAFVLRPDRDNIAYTTVSYYAAEIRFMNPELSADLYRWLDNIAEAQHKAAPKAEDDDGIF